MPISGADLRTCAFIGIHRVNASIYQNCEIQYEMLNYHNL